MLQLIKIQPKDLSDSIQINYPRINGHGITMLYLSDIILARFVAMSLQGYRKLRNGLSFSK
jgi:hypothetical protein